MNKLLIIIFVLCLSVKAFALPDFLIIGATKCGTTSLYNYLIQHPKIIGASAKKELKFFSNESEFAKGIKYYKSLFPVKNDASELVGEGTPGYFWKANCAKRIAKHCSMSKLILILRNPTKRAISHYFFCEDRKLIKNVFPRYETFEKALKDKSAYEGIINIGCYLDHINRWLKFFPRKQIHIVIFEDFVVNPEQEVNRVFNFLGLDDYKLDSYISKNSGSYKNGSIDPKTIDWLYDFYRPYNKKLEAFLGRALPWDKK